MKIEWRKKKYFYNGFIWNFENVTITFYGLQNSVELWVGDH